MFNKSTHHLIIALVCLSLATVACSLFTVKNQTASPLKSESTACPSIPNPPDPQSPNFSDRLNAVQGELQQANTLMQQEQYAAAILCWDDILFRVPEYADAYYKRSQSYWNLTGNQRVQTEYEDYLEHALADLNQAISLDPEVGDYYYARYKVENALADNEIYLVDKNFWYTQAYTDITSAVQFGTKGELVDRNRAFLLVDLGRCNEAVDEANRTVNSNAAEPKAALHTILAYSSQCLGNYDPALEYIDSAISLYSSFPREFARASILYNMGRLDEALDEVNKLIADQRYYCGCRYYLRALIYYDQGKKDLAQADIDFGTGQTWERGGIRSYVLGHLALDAGDQQQGITLLQEAEASLTWGDGSLRKRVQKELETLGSTPLSLTVSAPATPTLLPVTPQIQPPTPTVIVLDKPVDFEGTPMAYLGNAPITFMPDKPVTFHFIPPQPLNFAAVDTLVLTLVDSTQTQLQNQVVELGLWRPAYNDWQILSYDRLGRLHIDNADYVTSTGDIYGYIIIHAEEPAHVDMIGITLIVRNTDGGTSQYGMPLSP